MNNILYSRLSLVPNNENFLCRPQIDKLFRDSAQKPLINVVAGAGYGKTASVSDFLKGVRAKTIWLTLSEMDNLVTRLWGHFVYSISLINEDVAQKLTLLGFPDSIITFNKFLDIVTSAMQTDIQYFIVFDDFHLIEEKAIIDFVENLVNERLLGLTIILISRKEPNIRAIEMLSKGLISHVTEKDLCFSKNEMVCYLQNQDIKLSNQAVSDIYDYTEGWIFAISLIAMPLKKGILYEKSPVSAIRQDIFKMMESEIFLPASRELQKFLIKLSFIDNLYIELLKELASGNSELLTEIMKVGSFIHFDFFSEMCNIHNLLLEFLYEKQSLLDPDEIREVHIKAARWFVDNGYKIDGIIHYEKAGQYNEIIDIMMSYAGSCSKETADFMINVLDRMPADIALQREISHVLYARFLFNGLEIEKSQTLLTELKKKHEAMPDSSQNTAILGEIYVILGLLSFFSCHYEGKYDFSQLFQAADKCLPEGSTIMNKDYHLNFGTYVCMVRSTGKSNLNKFIKEFTSTIPYAVRVMNGCGCGMEYLGLTEYAFYQRDVKKAQNYAQRAIYKSKESEQYDIENMAVFYLIRINLSLGNYQEVVVLLNQLKESAERLNTSNCFIMLDIAEGWFYSVIGQPQKVARWIMDDIQSAKVTSPVTFGVDRLVRARCYLAEQKYDELLAFLEQNSGQHTLGDLLIGSIEIKILKAIALYRLNERAQGIEALREAYETAKSTSFFMPFVEHGSNMRALANGALNDENCTIPKDFLSTIYVKSSTYAKKIAHIVLEYKIANKLEHEQEIDLTKRELEVLLDLCHGLTREEIADHCNLSVNTVKTMLQNIYLKLGAINSSDAVRIATRMNLHI